MHTVYLIWFGTHVHEKSPQRKMFEAADDMPELTHILLSLKVLILHFFLDSMVK